MDVICSVGLQWCGHVALRKQLVMGLFIMPAMGHTRLAIAVSVVRATE